jgi:uncharacterized membrane protein YGL010W
MSVQLHALSALPLWKYFFLTEWLGGWVKAIVGLGVLEKRKPRLVPGNQTTIIHPAGLLFYRLSHLVCLP